MQTGPSRGAAPGLLALAVLLVVVATRTDATGALLALPGAVVAAALGVRDLVLTPVLEADGTGLRLVTGVRRLDLAWSQVDSLRCVTDRRAVLLEVETTDGRVVLLSRGRLGRDPRDVVDVLTALRDGAVPG